VRTRSKTLGLAAALTAIAVAVPTAIQQASAEPTTPSPAPTTASAATTTPTSSPASESTTSSPATSATTSPTTTTTTQTPVSPAGSVPTSTKVPDPQGSGCDDYRKRVPRGPGSIDSMALQTASQALASNPDLSTFSGFVSGKLNPDINIVNVIDGGPYVVFAPTNDAFAKLDPKTLETLKTDPVVLLPTLFYHLVLGYLQPNDIAGKMPTQDGRSVNVVGKGGDIKVNDAKVVCAFTAHGAYIYMIDTVLTPPTPAAEAGTTTSGTETSATTSATTTTSAPATTSATTTTAGTATTSATTTTTASATPAATTSETTAATTSTSQSPATPTTTTAKPAS
jgi:uncharacterized surface protein with fasciclin (FAS1) repeats